MNYRILGDSGADSAGDVLFSSLINGPAIVWLVEERGVAQLCSDQVPTAASHATDWCGSRDLAGQTSEITCAVNLVGLGVYSVCRFSALRSVEIGDMADTKG